MELKALANSIQELLEWAYRLREFTPEVLPNPKYRYYWPHFVSQNHGTLVMFIIEISRPFWCLSLWILKRLTVTMHHVIAVYNNIFNSIDGIMGSLPMKKTQWEEDLFFAVMLPSKKLFKYYAEVTPMTSMLLVAAHYLDHFRKLRLLKKGDKGMDINAEEEASYTTQYQEALHKYVQNEYCAKHRSVPIIKPESPPSSNLFPFATTSRPGLSSFDPYDLSSDDKKYLILDNVAETTPGWCNCAVHISIAARLYLNSPPEVTKNCGQNNPNLNDYRSDPMEISSTFCILDIAFCSREQEETHSQYADFSIVGRDIISIIPYGGGVEVSFSPGQDVIG